MRDKILIGTALSALSLAPAHAELDFNVYGIMKTSIISASQQITSFGNNTFSAPTHAAPVVTTNAATERYSKERRTSFQSQQTRFGAVINSGNKISARLEFDLIDFTQSTHAAGLQTRLRLAQMDYKFSDKLTLTAGQKWLSFMGVVPYMNNLVQANFYSGNTGFIGQEATLKYALSSVDLYAAIMAKGKNTTNSQTQTELGALPGISLRADYKFSAGLVGVAAIAAKMETEALAANTANTYQDGSAYAYKIFTKMNFGGLDFRAEAFQGQNTENLALLGIGGSSYKSATNTNIQTWGGFTSVAYKFNETHTFYTGAGYVANKDAAARLNGETATNNKMASNKMARIGYEYHLGDGAKIFFEDSQYSTKFVTSANSYKSYDANTAEIGLMWAFK